MHLNIYFIEDFLPPPTPPSDGGSRGTPFPAPGTAGPDLTLLGRAGRPRPGGAGLRTGGLLPPRPSLPFLPFLTPRRPSRCHRWKPPPKRAGTGEGGHRHGPSGAARARPPPRRRGDQVTAGPPRGGTAGERGPAPPHPAPGAAPTPHRPCPPRRRRAPGARPRAHSPSAAAGGHAEPGKRRVPQPSATPQRPGSSLRPAAPASPGRCHYLQRESSSGRVRSAGAGGLRRGAEQRLPGTGGNSWAAAVTPRAAPAGPAGEPAAAQQGASPAGGGWGRQEGGEAGAGPAPRPVPSPRFGCSGYRLRGASPPRPAPAASSPARASPSRAPRVPLRSIQPPAPSRRSFVTPTTPSGGWVGFFFSSPLCRRPPPAPLLLPLVTPPVATRAVSWTALLAPANGGRRGAQPLPPPPGPARRAPALLPPSGCARPPPRPGVGAATPVGT